MTVYLRGGIYHYDFSVAGRRHRGSTKQTTQTKAEKIEAKLIAEALEHGSAFPMRAPRLQDVADRFFEHYAKVVASGRRKKVTLRYYREGWKRLLTTSLPSVPVDRITRHVVSELHFPGSAAFANQAIRTLRRMLGMAEEWKMLPHAPALPLLPEDAREATIDPESEKALLANGSKVLRLALPIAQDCGMRRDEIARMQIENINWQLKTYFNAAGKTRKARRYVPLSQRVFDLLFVHCGKRTSDWVFPAKSKKSKTGHISPDALSHAFLRARVKAGLPENLVLHAARHTCGTYIYEATGNLKAVMDTLGHSDVRTAMRYQHPELDIVREAIDKRNAERHNFSRSEEVKQ